MKRQLKFRAKRLENGEWVYGDLLTTHVFDKDAGDEYTRYEIRGFQPNFGPVYYTVDGQTVGQFTGLTDRHGTEIYEGDVIMCETPFGDYFGYVSFLYGAFCVFGIEPDEMTDEIDIADVMGMDDVDLRPLCTPFWESEMSSSKMHPCSETAEVIGNVHDDSQFRSLPQRHKTLSEMSSLMEYARLMSFDLKNGIGDKETDK